MATDNFSATRLAPMGPANRLWVLTKSDSVEIDPRPRAIRCLTDGTAAIKDIYGNITPVPMTAGDQIDVRAAYLMETGTSGTYAALE